MRIRLLAVIALLSALSVMGCGPVVAQHQAPASTPVAIATTTTTPTAAPAQDSAANRVVYLEVSGAGTKTTKQFSAVGDWNLVWSFDCTKLGLPGNFIVNVMTSTGRLDFRFQPVNQLDMQGHDTEFYHATVSDGYLTINSECTWTVLAEG